MSEPENPRLEAHFAKLGEQLVENQGMPEDMVDDYLEWMKTHTQDKTLGFVDGDK